MQPALTSSSAAGHSYGEALPWSLDGGAAVSQHQWAAGNHNAATQQQPMQPFPATQQHPHQPLGGSVVAGQPPNTVVTTTTAAAEHPNVVVMLPHMNGGGSVSGVTAWVSIASLQQQQQQQQHSSTRNSSGSASPHHLLQQGGFNSSNPHSPNGSGSPVGASFMPPGSSAHPPHHHPHPQHNPHSYSYQPQQHSSSLSDGYLVVVDPLSRKLKLSLSDVTPTRAMSRSGIPSLCLLHMAGKCRQGTNCHQVHANERVVQQLRETAANQPVCCAVHGDVNEMHVRPAWKSLVFTIANVTIPVDHVAYTAGLKRLVDEHLTNVTLPASPQVSVCVSGRVVSSGGVGLGGMGSTLPPCGTPVCASTASPDTKECAAMSGGGAPAAGASDWALSSQAVSSACTTIPGALSRLSLDGQTTEFSVLSKPPSMVDTLESDGLPSAAASGAVSSAATASAGTTAFSCVANNNNNSAATSLPAGHQPSLTAIPLAASSICRLHAEKGGCRYAEDCKFLHVCREVVRRDLRTLMPPPPPPAPSPGATAAATVPPPPSAGSPPSHGWSGVASACSPTLPRVAGAAVSSGASSASPSPIHFLPAATLPAGAQQVWFSYATGSGNVLVGSHVSTGGGSAHGSSNASPIVIVGSASSPVHFATTPQQPSQFTSVAVGGVHQPQQHHHHPHGGHSAQSAFQQQQQQHAHHYSTHQPLFQSFGSPQTLLPAGATHSLSSESSASPPPLPPLVPLHVFSTTPHGSPQSAHAQVPSRRGSLTGTNIGFASFVPAAPNTTSSSAHSSATASPRLEAPSHQLQQQQQFFPQQPQPLSGGSSYRVHPPQQQYVPMVSGAGSASAAPGTHVAYHTSSSTSPIPGYNGSSTTASSAAGIPPLVHLAFPGNPMGPSTTGGGGGVPTASFAGPSTNPSFNFSIGSNPVALPMDYFGNSSVTAATISASASAAGGGPRNPTLNNVGRSSQSSSCCASPPMAGSPRDRGVIGPPSFGMGGVSASTSLQGGDVLATPEGDLLHSLEVLLRSGE